LKFVQPIDKLRVGIFDTRIGFAAKLCSEHDI